MEAVEADIIVGSDLLNRDVLTAGGCDIISDLLFFGRPGMLLLTGLTQSTVIKTAQLIDISAVVFVRGKVPEEEAVELARGIGLPLLVSPHSLYDCCGRLYARGLPGVIPAKGRASAGRA
jgi:hypothetical protein